MRRRALKPNTYIFNQFLRCVRDCGIGDVNETIESVNLIAERANKHRIAAGGEIVSISKLVKIKLKTFFSNH